METNGKARHHRPNIGNVPTRSRYDRLLHTVILKNIPLPHAIRRQNKPFSLHLILLLRHLVKNLALHLRLV